MKDPLSMTGSELKDWLRDRLQMKGEASADIDARAGESPYEGALRLWESGDSAFQREFVRAIKALIKEAASEPWSPEHFHELCALIETAELDQTADTLEDFTHAPTLAGNDHGARLHMLALRTLLGLGWTGSPEF